MLDPEFNNVQVGIYNRNCTYNLGGVHVDSATHFLFLTLSPLPLSLSLCVSIILFYVCVKSHRVIASGLSLLDFCRGLLIKPLG